MLPRRITDVLGPLNSVEARFAPPELWLAGDPTLLARRPRVSVVGTRRPTPDGQRRTRRLVRALVDADVTVVSGFALGIDTVAHTEVLERDRRAPDRWLPRRRSPVLSSASRRCSPTCRGRARRSRATRPKGRGSSSIA